MDLHAFIALLKPEGTYDAWVDRLAEGGRVITRAALEHYVHGRRRPEPDIFASLLTAAGRPSDDTEGWTIYARAAGIPESVLTDAGTAA